VSRSLDGRQILVHVDPQRPDAWRREPYYSQLKAWARQAVASRSGVIVVVRVGSVAHVVFPDRDVELGVVSDGAKVITSERMTPTGVRWDAKVSREEAPAPPAGNVGLATTGDAGLKAPLREG